MNKLACLSVISFLIFTVIISEISAQNPLNGRKRGSQNRIGLNQRDHNADIANDNGLPPENLIQRKPGVGQRRNRNRGNGQRQCKLNNLNSYTNFNWFDLINHIKIIYFH